jgi:hypothetical protein
MLNFQTKGLVLNDFQIIWLDVERRENDETPAMSTILINEQLRTYVHDLSLVPPAKARPQGDITYISWSDLVDELFEKTKAPKTLIGAYTESELDLLIRATPSRQAHWEKVYFNANAKRWFQKHYPEIYNDILAKVKKSDPFARVGLKNFLTHKDVGYKYPTNLRGFSPAAQINRLRVQFIRYGGVYKDYSAGSKRAWTNLVNYNREDVKGMQWLVQQIINNS